MERSEPLPEVVWLSPVLRLHQEVRGPIPFCRILPVHTPGWTALLTGLIFSLPQSALLSCLRLEPAAAEACICFAWGLNNLLLFPSSVICSFQVPPVCLLWHRKKVSASPPSSPSIEKSPKWPFHLVYELEFAPAACWVVFSSGTRIPKSISIFLREQTPHPLQDFRQAHEHSLLKRRINKQKWWCVQHQWHRAPKAVVASLFK